MKISHFLAKYAILAAILNFRTLAVSNVIGGQILWQIRVLRQIWPWKQPVLFHICKKSSDMPNPNARLSPSIIDGKNSLLWYNEPVLLRIEYHDNINPIHDRMTPYFMQNKV